MVNDIDLAQIIGEDDELDTYCEQLVSAPKIANEKPEDRKSHRVPNEFVLRVRVAKGTHQRLQVLAKRAGGQWFMSLETDKGEILRGCHYQHTGHPNPDGSMTGRYHKHFPSKLFPLLKGHRVNTWAYDPPVSFPNDFVDSVKCFCKECNIEVAGLQERLRWFR